MAFYIGSHAWLLRAYERYYEVTHKLFKLPWFFFTKDVQPAIKNVEDARADLKEKERLYGE